ncbi:MAG: hypothetical protein FWE74_11060 [Oscillospiraceae bacterium]|nr:hypothetical protein [Oscillospiraceae bacterium]
MSTNHDKRELLKLKQGLIEDSEVIKREEPEKIVLHGKKKVENFFYHYKVHVLMVVFFTVIGSFFIIEAARNKRADIRFLIVATSIDASIITSVHYEDIGKAIEMFTPNFDNNSYVYAEAFPVNVNRGLHGESFVANQTKLFAEIQLGVTRIVIGDRGAFEHILGETEFGLEDVFVNLSELYPGNQDIIDGIFFKVKDSIIAHEAGINYICPDDFYIAVLDLNRTKNDQERAHIRSLEVIDNIITGNVINAKT